MFLFILFSEVFIFLSKPSIRTTKCRLHTTAPSA